MTKVNENSSMLVVKEKTGSRLLVAQYDSTYPRELYRFRVNLIGGAQEVGDISPLGTMSREIWEEIIPAEVRNPVLKGMRHYKDFLSVITKPKSYVSVDSAFIAEIDDGLMEDIAEEIGKGKKLLTEGLARVVSLEELKVGSPLTAWSTGEILADLFSTEIPNPEAVRSIPLKTGLNSHLEYRERFEYKS